LCKPILGQDRLRSISAFGGTEKVKIAYAVSGIFFLLYNIKLPENTSHRISGLGWGPGFPGQS
jgi:hypothetical protein